MGLYNFQPRFVDPILAGTKRHTIRAPRRHPDRPGSTLHLYTGLRRKGARLLKRVECTAVAEIAITEWGTIRVDGRCITEEEAEELARRDGFADLAEMLEHWRGRLPFVGHMIFWSPDR
jgi:hypothetical protein